MKQLAGILKEKQLIQRGVLYAFGIFLVALGAAFTIVANLGVSAIQAVPLVLSLVTGLSIGTCLFFVLALFILLQVLILRKEFRWISLTQLLVSFLFGYFMDFSIFLLRNLQSSTYLVQFLMLLAGITLFANGLLLYVRGNLINMPPEGLTVALTKKIPNTTFHRVRIVQDCSLVAIAGVLSLLLLHGVYGIREGTLLSAVLIGKLQPYVGRLWRPVLHRIGLEAEAAS